MKSIGKIPSHIGIIMDGNGRWATRRGLPRNFGHKEGVKAIERTILACLKYGIKYCTFFAFSTENWRRSQEEIYGIFSILRDYLSDPNNIFMRNKIKVDSIGIMDPFPEDLINSINNLKENTKDYENLTVIFALNYGGRDDIIRAVNNLLSSNKQKVTDQEFLKLLDTKEIPEPEIVIRTSGEMRISNFMLYQLAYSEMFFPKTFWPDFNEKHLLKIIKEFQKRDRRFGGVH